MSGSSEPPHIAGEAANVEAKGFEPIHIYCHKCDQWTLTVVQTKRKEKAYLACILLFVFLIWPFCLIPMFIKRCKTPVHYCASCGVKLTESHTEKITKEPSFHQEATSSADKLKRQSSNWSPSRSNLNTNLDAEEDSDANFMFDLSNNSTTLGTINAAADVTRELEKIPE